MTATETRAATVAGRFAAQVAATPDAPALVADGRTLTYAELDVAANRVAWWLRARGAGPETVVGLHVERGPRMVVALLAVTKADAAYLPLDPESPPERHRFLLADAGAALVLADPGTTLDLDLPVAYPDEGELAALPETAPPVRAGADSLLYIVYTSGSTGQPKGIAMHHGPTVALMDWCARSYRSRPVALQYFPLTSDVCTYELLSTWWQGGCAVVASEHERFDVPALGDLIDRHAVTTVLLPFVGLEQLAHWSGKNPDRLRSVRELVTTGDRLVVTPAIRALAARLPGAFLDNQWGSTEVNVVTALRLAPPAADWPEVPAIGRPVTGCRVHVLDEALAPVPINVPGVIHVGGGPLARGYVGRPDLTAAGFLPDPFAPEPGARMYRTGDVGRWRPDGTLEFVGRSDFQIKLHGYRIEPGEIESRLRTRPEVDRAAVTAVAPGTPEGRLVALVTAAGDDPPDPWALREHLRAALPPHLVPHTIAVVDALPLTATGKIDRKQLGALVPADAGPPPYVAPRDELETAIATVWADVLGVEQVGAEDDFFALGGHSLLLAQAAHRTGEALGATVPTRSLFIYPTVAQLATHLRRELSR